MQVPETAAAWGVPAPDIRISLLGPKGLTNSMEWMSGTQHGWCNVTACHTHTHTLPTHNPRVSAHNSYYYYYCYYYYYLYLREGCYTPPSFGIDGQMGGMRSLPCLGGWAVCVCVCVCVKGFVLAYATLWCHTRDVHLLPCWKVIYQYQYIQAFALMLARPLMRLAPFQEHTPSLDSSLDPPLALSLSLSHTHTHTH